MSIKAQARRWWDNAISDWMDYADRDPRYAAGFVIALMMGYAVIIPALVIAVALR